MSCGPLHGIRVADMTQMLAGPVATQMLGDLGAEVIKVEPHGGERARGGTTDPPRWLFLGRNRNKRGIVVDLKRPEGLDVMHRLASQSDVFVHNQRPAAVQRLGLGYDDLKQINDRLVYASASGYGDRGELSDLPGQDMQLQAFSGLAGINGYPDDPRPSPPAGAAVVDSTTGILIALGVMAALYDREKTGRGQEVKTSLLGGALLLQENSFGPYLATGKLPRKAGNGHPGSAPPYGIWRASDGKELGVSSGVGPEVWPNFCNAIGRPQLIDDPRFSTAENRLTNRDELFECVNEAMAARPRDEWIRVIRKAGIWAAPVSTYDELTASTQLDDNDLLVDNNYPAAGDFKSLNTPISLGNSKTVVRHRPPGLGEHTREVLTELGYATAEIDSMYRKNVVA
ncbi:MAG: CoA transferase [SAR202 cluster bacterium]|nr:CoA transferase [SAR202 cluster bacterium]MDP6302612.1 CoA transferase [SAR202 cluster bacterium]MDP7105273.1 CoA transferase [SAR202 cluster bacterium]MDP7226865.1 CoA transferase [SAR202 cluster bacterium]HJO81285.1 CoA transferase [SAR202 cluster bacterium]